MSETNRELRNAIFSAKQAAENGRMSSTQQPGAKEALALEIPVIAVPLPSKGLLYPEDHPLHNVSVVDIKAMTTKEEDILMNRNFVRRGTVITELIQSCLTEKIEATNIISGDRNALMFAIRISGYGGEYTPKIHCPRCNIEQPFPISLGEVNESELTFHLPIKELDLNKIRQVEPFTNLFECRLPLTQKVVIFKFLTGAEEEKILQNAEAMKKKGIVSEAAITSRLINSVLSVDGHTSRDIIVRFCSNLPARDSLALRKYIDENEPGIQSVADFSCNNPDCDPSIQSVPVPLGPSFFWPNVDQ